MVIGLYGINLEILIERASNRSPSVNKTFELLSNGKLLNSKGFHSKVMVKNLEETQNQTKLPVNKLLSEIQVLR